jgi:NAD(P)H-flavin reductase
MTEDDGWEGESRRISAEMLHDHLDELPSRTYLVEGPPPLVEAVVEELQSAGVPEEQILPDRFSGY